MTVRLFVRRGWSWCGMDGGDCIIWHCIQEGDYGRAIKG
jgi:hypothetical protein